MSYSVIYSNEFDSLDNLLTLRLQIEKKDFTGSPIDIILSGNPIIQEWQEDDQKAPIRGCTLKVNIITDSSGISLTDFYSDDDNTFKAILKRAQTDEVLFVGYLLQDDCAELYVDFNHEISLTFTDHLALLKDITLDQAAVNIGQEIVISAIDFINYSPPFVNTIRTTDSRVGVLKDGDAFTLYDGTNTYNLICYHINYVGFLGYFINIGVAVPFSGTVTFDLTYTAPVELTGYFSLAEILRLCLRSTDLDLNTTVATSLYPVGGSTQELVLDTYLSINTFLKNDQWMNCYDILEIILSRFNASLFQAHGRWFIVRFDEIYRYFGASKPVYTVNVYNYEFVPGGASANITQHSFANSNDQETGVIKSIVRPLQFVKETFNYVQPESLLCNYNLQDLGDLLNEYSDSIVLVKEYSLLNWYDGPYSPHPSRYIRVVYDNDNTSIRYKQEIERIIVVVSSTGSAPTSVKSCDIPLTKGDAVEFNFSFRTSNSQPGNINTVFVVTITDGVNTYFVQNNGSWANISTFTFNVAAGDNTNEWHTVNMKTSPTPINGMINCYLAEATPNGSSPSSDETQYKDLSLTINYLINGSGKIIGHNHKEYQLNNLKNNIDREIFIDNTPRVSITGSIYLESYTDLLRDLTTTWKYQSGSDVYITLGGVATAEALWTNYILRTKYELTYRQLYENDKILTPFSCFVNYLEGTAKQYIPGKMTIDYKSANCNLTLREVVSNVDGIYSPQIDEFIAFFAARFYEFNYIHEKS